MTPEPVSGPARPLPLPLFDTAEFGGRLGEALRRAGLPVTPERTVCFLRSLRLVPPVDREALYWTARLAFVTDRELVAPFERVFEGVFGGLAGLTAERGDRTAAPPDAAEDAARVAPSPGARTAPGPSPAGTGPARTVAGPRTGEEADGPAGTVATLGSTAEVVAHKDFAALDAAELAALDRLMELIVLRTPLRRTRRRDTDPHGPRVDPRRTLRAIRTTGLEPVRLARSRPRLRRRPLVLLCDVSGSMEPYARAYLRLFPRAAAVGVAAEVFVFATRLTRLTPVLRRSGRSGVDAALRRAGAAASDWSGGTRIGHALAEFNDRFGRRGMARGAIVVIFSDGWEGEDPRAVGREAARLRRLAHRVVWVNPRKAAPGYLPLAGGMAAALPHCDEFVSGHTFAALAEVADAIGGSARGKGTGRENGSTSGRRRGRRE
ncbi:VWA domain-containing protein [Streptomyces sp. PA03-1a]|nr:VWA domain-containing protein [Streptomyces sp. PA03-1a]MDX2814861.1 VWA domain-containing protein [Streptomyces sp. PA03-5A]